MSADLVIAGMLRIARQDLDAARILNQAGNRNAPYHCEQAAEKVIRALLTSEGVHAGTRHELADMINLLPDENPFKTRLRAIEHLSLYATAYRYASPRGRLRPAPSIAEVDTDIAKIDAVFSEVVARFGVDLTKETGATKPDPIR